MKKGFRSKECKSCNVNKQSCYVPHYFRVESKTYQCPCKKCLVKVMCAKSCHYYEEYCKAYFNKLKDDPLEYFKHISENTERSIATKSRYEIRKVKMGRDTFVLSEIKRDLYKRGADEYHKKNND
jgi:hypothetical protein